MEQNTVKDQSELSEVTRPILNQEDRASSNFPNIDNDSINNTERQYKAEPEEKVSDQITTNMTIDTQNAEGRLVSNNSEESKVLNEDNLEKESDEMIANMTIATQSAEIAMIRRNSEGNDIPNENIAEKVPERNTANMAIETQNVDIGSMTSNFEKIENPRKDIKLMKHVEDAPSTFVDHIDGLMKWLGKACGVGKEKMSNEDLEPYTKLPSGRSKEMGHTASEEGGFNEVKLNAIHHNFEKRVRERLAYQCDENVVITETVNERGNLDYKRAHSDLRCKEMNVNCDVRGYVPNETATQEEKQHLYKKNQEPRHENKLPNPNHTNFTSRPHKGQTSHDSTQRGYDDVYNFNHPQRGYMLTIVNDKFVRRSPRNGAQLDLEKMKEIGRKFGFRSLNHNQEKNLTKEQLLRLLRIARRTNHSECDCFMFMISTHGQEQEKALKGGQVDHALVCADDQLIFTSTILDMFNDENCPTLKGKPKIFYIQACRGEQLDNGGDVLVTNLKNEDKTCGVSNEEETGRKGRESLDESDTNFGEDSLEYNQEYGARGFTGGQALSSASYHTTPSHQHSVSHNPTPSASSQVPVSGHTNPSNQFSQASLTRYQHNSADPSSSITYNAQVPNYQQPSFKVPKVSQPTRSKVLHAPGHLVSRIDAPTPYAIVDTPSLKCDNDMLIMYATPPGMFAWRSPSEGSWMIDYLHKVLMAYDMKRPRNFLNLMTKVSSLMSQRASDTPKAPAMHQKKVVSVIEYKLVKDIFFK